MFNYAAMSRGEYPPNSAPVDMFWFNEAEGELVSSDYYFKELPAWVKKFDAGNRVAKYFGTKWDRVAPADAYKRAQAEYLRVPYAQANLAKIPDELTDEQVVLLADIASTGFGGAEADVARATGPPAVRLMDHAEMFVPAAIVVQGVRAAVGRTVVHRDHVERASLDVLRCERIQQLRQVRERVIYRHHHGYRWLHEHGLECVVKPGQRGCRRGDPGVVSQREC
jgi:hypothetical protein